MEEMMRQLYELQNLTIQLDYINGLLYLLRESLRIQEDVLNIHYTLASAYISNQLMAFEEELDALMEGMFRTFGAWSGMARPVFAQ